jgi:glycosyltransferase involved in cell wall biosynthesis
VKHLGVIIPSRNRPGQANFLSRALKSIETQTARASVKIEVVIGLDPGDPLPELPQTDLPIRCAHAAERLQAAALNAAASLLASDYVAFLEDDDRWQTGHLAVALESFRLAQFASTTQLEVNPAGDVLRINDFPTPSGWVMPRSTWEQVGPFDASFRYHLDSEWLGRLGTKPLERIHIVEATAPAGIDFAQEVRPSLVKALTCGGGGRVKLARHGSPFPNVVRLVHPESGMHQLANDPIKRQVRLEEMGRLQARFGRLPW